MVLSWHLCAGGGTVKLAVLGQDSNGEPPAYKSRVLTLCHPVCSLKVVYFFTALYALWSPWWLLLCCEALEFLTLSLAWLAAILYLRHLVPRHLTATGQGLAVAAHFCIGRSIGSIIAGALSSGESGKYIYNLFIGLPFAMSNNFSQLKQSTFCTNKRYKYI
jgi:hypothetical protein